MGAKAQLGAATPRTVAQRRCHEGPLPVERMDQHGRRPRGGGAARVGGQAERALVEKTRQALRLWTFALMRGHSVAAQWSMAAWSRVRRRGAPGAAPSSRAGGAAAPTRAPDGDASGQPLDDHSDAIQDPQLTDEPVGSGALPQGLLDPAELGIRQPWSGTVGPRLSRASGPPACQRACYSLTLGGRRQAGGRPAPDGGRREQLGGTKPAGLEAVTFLLRRRTARSRWHGPSCPGEAISFSRPPRLSGQPPRPCLDAASAQPGVEHARHLLGVVDDLGHGLGPSGAVVTGERLDRAGRVRSGVRVWRLHTPGSSRWTALACRAWKQPVKTRGGLRRRSRHRGSIGPRLRADRRQGGGNEAEREAGRQG